jgi:hypothetical protein
MQRSARLRVRPGLRLARASVVACGLALAVATTPATLHAQSASASIQGTVSDQTGALPGAAIAAREQQSGFEYAAVSDATGRFTLAGLRPGTYAVTASLDKFKPRTQTVQALIGQTLTVNIQLSADLAYTEQVDVVAGAKAIETRSSQITTNVTDEQIRLLPQNSRNFLNFAGLAPGIRVTDGEFDKQVSAAGQSANQTNVFIDGVSYKNDVLEGGVIGQNTSRGNPFPQNAVQEFQVLTQNYKAEYEKAGTAIISAVTKSGGNRWTGELFNFYQDKRLVQKEYFAERRGLPKPAYERWQWGLSAGGPIVPDRIQVFGSYEENRQDRQGQVVMGTIGGGNQPPASLVDSLAQKQGLFTSPFRSRLLFAKLSAQPREGQNLEVTYNLRNETDIRSFGGLGADTDWSFEAAENDKNRVDSLLGKYQIAGTKWLNQSFFSYQRYRWNPEPQNLDIIGQDYDGLMRIGGRDSPQEFTQARYSLRHDTSYFVNGWGAHTLKAGGVASYLQYDGTKFLFGNPLFTYQGNISWNFPSQAQYGVGNPSLAANNWQVGWFAQDDWRIGQRLTLNLGVRWDFESDMLNNDYVTPANVIAATSPFVDANRYFTDGTDRPAFKRAWQPRLGASYDVAGEGRTVLFGGWGRNYDRVLYNYTYDERYRQQFAIRKFLFSADGSEIRDGQQTLAWNPAYLSVAGLESVIASGQAPNPEVYLIANDTKPPVSDQFSVGIRQRLWNTVISASYSGLRSRNGLTFLFGNRKPDGSCCASIPGFTNILVSSDAKKYWYDALYLQIDKPYGAGGASGRLRWGYSLTYTLSKSTQIGGDLFSLDFPTVADYPRYPTPNDERHRLVASGIVSLPWDVLLSTLITLGSGTPFTVTDESAGTGANERIVRRNAGRPTGYTFIVPDAWAYRTVDLRVEKAFRFNQNRQLAILLEGFNIFSFENYSDFDGSIPALPATNPNFGKPRQTLDPGRRLQVGVRLMY